MWNRSFYGQDNLSQLVCGMNGYVSKIVCSDLYAELVIKWTWIFSLCGRTCNISHHLRGLTNNIPNNSVVSWVAFPIATTMYSTQ